MCTVILALAPGSSRPLLIGANRDEALDRPAEPARWRSERGVRWFGPRDLEAQGTWMGVNQFGLWVGLTNRFGPSDPDRRSRGQLVLDALQHPDEAAARAWAHTLRGRDYNGFHLLLADPRSASVHIGNTERLTSHPLGRGVHVVTERAFGAAPSARQDGLEARYAGQDPERLGPEELKCVLREGGGFDAVCVQVPERNYGTRSSVVLSHEGSVVSWEATDRPPDRSDYERTRLELGPS